MGNGLSPGSGIGASDTHLGKSANMVLPNAAACDCRSPAITILSSLYFEAGTHTIRDTTYAKIIDGWMLKLN
jgi:hypothetical protein